MKKIWMLLLALVVLLTIAGCKKEEQVAERQKDRSVTIKDIQVQTQGENHLLQLSSLVVTSDLSALKVDLVFEGDAAQMAKLRSDNITIIADVSKIDRAGENDVVYTVTLPGDIPAGTVTVKTQTPSVLKIKTEPLTHKEVPLKLSYDLKVMEKGHNPDETLLQYPEKVSVSGPESVIETIDHAAAKLDLAGRTESYENEAVGYVFCDANGNEVDSKLLQSEGTVPVTLPILYSKLIPLKLEYKDGGGATAKDAIATFFVDDGDGNYNNDRAITGIMVSGSHGEVENAKSLTLGTVDLAKVFEGTKLTFDLKEVLKDEPFKSEYSVERIYAVISFPTLKELVLENVVLDVNKTLDSKLRVVVDQRRVSVIIRGPAELVDRVKRSDIVAYLDLSDAKAGTGYYSIKVEFVTEAFASLGATASVSEIQVQVIAK